MSLSIDDAQKIAEEYVKKDKLKPEVAIYSVKHSNDHWIIKGSFETNSRTSSIDWIIEINLNGEIVRKEYSRAARVL